MLLKNLEKKVVIAFLGWLIPEKIYRLYHFFILRIIDKNKILEQIYRTNNPYE